MRKLYDLDFYFKLHTHFTRIYIMKNLSKSMQAAGEMRGHIGD